MIESRSGRTLYSVQVFRGLAALLVVLFHGTQFISRKFGVAPLGGLFFFGFAGLHLFFVLSGYIIYFIHRPDIGLPRRFFGFARKRIIRIYPAYWAILRCFSPAEGQAGSGGAAAERGLIRGDAAPFHCANGLVPLA